MIAGYLSELADRLTARLGDRLLGAWVIGSGALGGFDAQRSDIGPSRSAAEPTRLPPDPRPPRRPRSSTPSIARWSGRRPL